VRSQSKRGRGEYRGEDRQQTELVVRHQSKSFHAPFITTAPLG